MHFDTTEFETRTASQRSFCLGRVGSGFIFAVTRAAHPPLNAVITLAPHTHFSSPPPTARALPSVPADLYLLCPLCVVCVPLTCPHRLARVWTKGKAALFTEPFQKASSGACHRGVACMRQTVSFRSPPSVHAKGTSFIGNNG